MSISLDDFKKEIQTRTGVPASLLTGETSEEVIARAKALIAYRREVSAQDQPQAQTTAQQFADWFGSNVHLSGSHYYPVNPPAPEPQEGIASGYPSLPNPGEPAGVQAEYYGTTAQQFAQWLRNMGIGEFNPFTDSDGWTRII